ncbi:MAG: hypothetical protein F2644_01685, partial [Actinobacteria bacterium]|nr:hypothetical protein [Actinomycetota bacterium]
MTRKTQILTNQFGRRSGLTVSLLMFISSCGVPTSSEFVQIPDANIPFELNATSTTTTSTLPVEPDANRSSSNSQNTPSEIVNETVDLYFIIANRLVATKIQIVSP